MVLTPEQVLARLQKELGKYGYSFEDNSDEDISRQSITRLGIDGKSTEVARVTEVTSSKLEITVFERRERDTITCMIDDISERIGIDYQILRGY